MRWIIGAGNLSCWLGIYEYKKQKLFVKKIRKGTVVYDIGGHAGFYTLLSSSLVGPTGKVYVFEPLPQNLDFIEKHLELNKIRNATVIPCAVSDKCGQKWFKVAENNYMGKLSCDGNLKVQVIAIDELYTKGNLLPPNYIKIDVEGEEYQVIVGARRLLSIYKPLIFLATHSSEAYAQCSNMLKNLGYKLSSIGKNMPEGYDELVAKAKREA